MIFRKQQNRFDKIRVNHFCLILKCTIKLRYFYTVVLNFCAKYVFFIKETRTYKKLERF